MYTAFTFGVRVGEVAGVRHGAQFARSRKAEAGTGGPCAREGMYGCAACWVQVRERRRAAACLQPAAPQGVAVANQFAALPVEEPAVRHETLRHVITECEATEGRKEMAEEQARHAGLLRAALAEEEGTEPARAHAQRAQQGWLAVAEGRQLTCSQWQAMESTLGGVMPAWRHRGDKEGEAAKRATLASGHVRQMQRATIEHLRAHRKRGAKGAAWIEARVTCAPQLQLLLRAWRRVVTAPRPLTAAAAAAEEAALTQEQWRDFKSKERKSQRAQRRLDECVALLREAKLAHFAALRAARRARVRAAFLREALRIKLLRARRRRAGRRVAGFVIMAQARLARRHAGRAVRSDTLLSTVKSIQRGDFPTRRAAAARAAPSTPRLVSAARVGPVVYGLLLTFRGGGYG